MTSSDNTPNRDALEALTDLLPELEHGRETHRQWRDHVGEHPDELKRNPAIGDADFHARMVEIYDKRLDAINKACRALTAPPTVPEVVRRLAADFRRHATDLRRAAHPEKARQMEVAADKAERALDQHSEPENDDAD